MRFGLFDFQGNRISGGSTSSVGGQSPAPGPQPMATYDRMDVGILALQQLFQPQDIYDFRVPGDPNKVTFQYKFPRSGYIFGVSLTGTVSATTSAGIYVTKGVTGSSNRTDVMLPTDAGNTQTYDTTNFPSQGMLIMAPSPIAYAQGDTAQMKFKSMSNSQLTVNLAGFLLVGLNPQ